MKNLLFIMALLASAFIVKAQNRATDSQAIEKQIDAMIYSWNNHNYNDMNNYITPDCDWVNIVGTWWKGSKEVKFAHQAFHDAMFKNTPMKNKHTKISFLSADVALVHFISHVGSFTSPSGHVMPEADDLATLIFVKKNNKWLLRAGENVVIDPIAQKFNPANQMPKQ